MADPLNNLGKAMQYSIVTQEGKTAKAMSSMLSKTYQQFVKDTNQLLQELTLSPDDTSKAWKLARIKAMGEQIAKAADRFAKLAKGQIDQDAAKAAEKALKDAEKALKTLASKGVHVDTTFNKVPIEALQQVMAITRENEALAQLFAQFGPEAQMQATDVLLRGVAVGKTPALLAKELQAVLGTTLTRATLISRTEILRAYRNATHVYYKENEDVLRGWIWHANLGARTCASCIAMHGTVHSLDEVLDDHPAGRCVPLPWVKTATEMGVPGSDVQPVYPDGEKWLEQQPAERQIEALGKQGREAWQAGQVKLSDFVQTTYSPTWGTSRGKTSLAKALEHAAAGNNPHAGVHLTKFLQMELAAQENLVKQALKVELDALAGHDIEKLGKITGQNKKPGWFGPGIKKADKIDKLVAETHPDDLKMLVSSMQKVNAEAKAEAAAQAVAPTVTIAPAPVAPIATVPTEIADEVAKVDLLEAKANQALAQYGITSQEYKDADAAWNTAYNQFQAKHLKTPTVWKHQNPGWEASVTPAAPAASVFPASTYTPAQIEQAYSELEGLTQAQLHHAINQTSQFVPSSWSKYDLIAEVKAYPDDVVAEVYEKAFGKVLGSGAQVSEIEAEIANLESLVQKWKDIHDGVVAGDLAQAEQDWNKAQAAFKQKWNKNPQTAKMEIKTGKSVQEMVDQLSQLTKAQLKKLMNDEAWYVPSTASKADMITGLHSAAKGSPEKFEKIWNASGFGVKTKASMLADLSGLDAEAIKTGITNAGMFMGQTTWGKDTLMQQLGFLNETELAKILAEAKKAQTAQAAVEAASHAAQAAQAQAAKVVQPGATIEQDYEAIQKVKAKWLAGGLSDAEESAIQDALDQAKVDFQAKHGKTLLNYTKEQKAQVQANRGNVIMFQKTGAAQGSNAGGFYTGHDGVKRYVKEYADPTQAWAEHLSNDIYRALGLQAPKSEVFTYQGKVYYASEIMEGATPISSATLTVEQAQAFAQGFVADVITANWDAVGMSMDNILWLDGKVARIDNGGTLLFRARAGRKLESVLDDVQELDGYFDHFLNPSYATVMQKAGISKLDDLGEQFVRQVAALRREVELQGGWANWLRSTSPGLKAEDAARIERMLDARMEKLIKRADEMAAKLGVKPVQSAVARAGSAEEILAQDVDDAVRAGWQGKSLAIDTVDIEDQNVMLFQDVLQDGTKRTVLELKVRPDSDAKVRQAVSQSLVSGGLPAGVPLDADSYYDDILKAVKTVNFHTSDGTYNMGAVNKARGHRSILELITTDPGPDAETKAMARHYLDWLDGLEKAMANKETVTNSAGSAMFSQYLRQTAVAPSSGAGEFVATKSKPTFTERQPDGQGGLRVTRENATQKEIGADYNENGEQLNIAFHDGTKVRYRTWSDDTNYAQRGTMEIVIDGEPTVERVQQALANVGKLGIDAEAATAEDMEILYLKKMAYIRKEDGSFEFGKALADAEGQPKAEQVRILREYWNKRLKVPDVAKLDGYNPFGEYQYGHLTGRNNAGWRVQMRFDVSEADVKQHMGDRLFFMSDTTGGIDKTIEAVLQHNGSLMANMEKARAGVPLKGMSVASDMGSGGANYVFTRVKTSRCKEAGYFWKPGKLTRRMDAITYDHDAFGNVKESYVKNNRYYRLEDIRSMTSHSSNETIFKHNITVLDNLDHIQTSGPSERAAVIAKFHSAGVTRLPDGRLVEEVVK